MNALLAPMLAVVGLTGLGVVLVYSLFAPWWSTRSGRAVFALYWVFILAIGHFAAEAAWGEAPSWHEALLLLMAECVLVWNGYIIVSKQVIARRNQEAGH